MPAPSASILNSTTISLMNQEHISHPSFVAFIAALSNEISSKWDTWRASMSFGSITVVGGGYYAWSGSGTGGSITASPFTISPPAVITAARFPRQTAPTLKMLQNLSDVLQQQFATWISSYKFAGLSFVGETNADSGDPGNFQAVNTSTALQSCGSGQNPSGIASAWNDKLGQEENGVVFNVTKNWVAYKDFTQALGASVERNFASLWLASLATSNSVSGSAAPYGVGSGNSQTNGKII